MASRAAKQPPDPPPSLISSETTDRNAQKSLVPWNSMLKHVDITNLNAILKSFQPKMVNTVALLPDQDLFFMQ
ncbi:hypothetical protein FRX31_010413 [Thalictrum thalictroides]|uniref:Uncharacterized protein n=1 Tax=Thalictrum thalictroides TaxID=46969 RepID=A0A7J6WSK9_THATH|nr:hypothetical protein FRX31_010413 [Thalictrum thalictroides]